MMKQKNSFKISFLVISRGFVQLRSLVKKYKVKRFEEYDVFRCNTDTTWQSNYSL